MSSSATFLGAAEELDDVGFFESWREDLLLLLALASSARRRAVEASAERNVLEGKMRIRSLDVSLQLFAVVSNPF